VRPTLASYSVGTRVFSGWKSGQNVRLATHHLVSRLGMSGVVPLPPMYFYDLERGNFAFILLLSGPGWLSRYSDSLRARRSGDRIPVGGEILRTLPDRLWGPPGLLYSGYRVSLPTVKRPECGVDHPLPSNAEVKE
jgi:hypothetical protein